MNVTAPPPSRAGPAPLWRRHAGWLVLLAAAAAFLLPLTWGDLRHDAPIYAWMAKRVAVTGDWLDLYWDYDGKEPYYNKPPGQFWLTALAFKAFGVNVPAARVVPALFYVLSTLLLYRIVRLRAGVPVAAAAALVFCLHRELLMNVSEVRLDAGLLLAQLLCAYGGLRLLTMPRGRASNVTSWTLIGLGVGFGLMVRGGPVLFALPILAVAAAWCRRWDLTRPRLGHVVAIVVALAIAAPWYAYYLHAHGKSFTSGLGADSIAQHADLEGRDWSTLLFYYVLRLPESLGIWLPAVALGAWALRRRRAPHPAGESVSRRVGESKGRARRNPLLAFTLLWLAIYFVLIHFTALRTIRYAIPLFPWLSVLAAFGLLWVLGRRKLSQVIPWAVAAMVLIAAAMQLGRVHVVADRDPELARLAAQLPPVTDPAHRPTIWLYGSDPAELNWQKRCAIQFATDCRTQVLAEQLFFFVRPGSVIAVFVASDDEDHALVPRASSRIREAFPRARLIESGERYQFFRIE